jgi:hypothetical protein
VEPEVVTYEAVEVEEIKIVEEVEKTTEEKVREYFADIPIMITVAKCESTFRQFNQDGTVLRGRVDPRDTGVMQINTYYHGETVKKMELDIETLEGNLAYARHLYDTQGIQPWSASFPCMGV